MLEAKQAYLDTVGRLQAVISKEILVQIEEKIKEAIELGKGDVFITTESLGYKGKSKLVRQLETYLRALGYGAEVGYGCTSLTIRWV